MADFKRPEDGFRFKWGGVNTEDVPDSLPDGKYQVAVNIRATAKMSLRTRPGYDPLFTCNNAAVTDIRAYTDLNSNSFPRFLARDANGRVFLDNGTNVGNLNGNAGYGAAMVPFRPRESALSWMYVAGGGDYQRFSAPDPANNAVAQAKAGIAEPQTQVDAGTQAPQWTPFSFDVGGWNNSGTAGALGTGVRSNDTALACLNDPVVPSRFYVELSNNSTMCAIGETVNVNNNTTIAPIIQDVLPAISSNLAVQTVRYLSGNSGVCTVVPSRVAFSDRVSPGSMAGLRKGCLVNIDSGNFNETVAVRDVIAGANGILAFEIFTGLTFAGGATLIGKRAICLDYPGHNFNTGDSLTVPYIESNIATGIGYVSTAYNSNTNPFAAFLLNNSNASTPQNDDYLHLSVMFSDPTKLIEMQIQFNLANNSNDFTQDLLYYAVRPGDLAQVPSGNATTQAAILAAAENKVIDSLATPGNISAADQTSVGQNQWTEVTFPISALTRLGGDQSKTLAACSGLRLQINTGNNLTFRFGCLWVGGGSSPDVGNNGAEYKYLAVPMNSNTGVQGNPTALMKYGVAPRRQSVLVATGALNNSYDPQIDTWAVYRFGGTINSYRFLGTVPVGNNFTDNFFDDTPAAGAEVVIDNTEPWPTIDQPWRLSGNATAFGQYLHVASSVVLPGTMNRWLPGTVFQIGSSQDAFTLRSRPVISGNNTTLEFQECIGSGNQASVFVLEPNVARQPLPYVWGPNEEGYFFGAGDPYRPGCVYWAKAYAPDAVPTKYNLELCQPAEPLLGGEVIRGLSMVASSKRWWYLNFQQGSDRQLYVQVEAPVGKPLAAPYGHCTDGQKIYFWSQDGIDATDGGPAQSLTDDDLYNLFPHAGTTGTDVVRVGVTFYAPDYSRVAQFRLTYRNGMLFAFYLDTGGNRRTLVCNVHDKAWSQDQYADSITVAYSVEQPKAALTGSQNLYPTLVLGDAAGKVWTVKDLTNDGGNGSNSVPISVVIATREFNGGDARTDSYWGDQYLDVLAPAGMNATPITQGVGVANATVIPANNARQFVPVSVGGATLQSFLGLKLNWSDDFRSQSVPTQVNVWQPSYVDRPETTTDRFGDWKDFGEATYVRGATIYADTLGANKVLMIRNADNNQLYPLQGGHGNANSSIINHNGEQTISYWFDPPFVAHMVREEPQDLVPWRKFSIQWLKDSWPELTDIASPWMNVRDTGQAAFLQGLVLPLEVGDANNNTAPQLKLRVDSSNNLIDMVPWTDPRFNVKTGVAYSLATPVVCHQVQIIPQHRCRVWWNEIEWKTQATPELATKWQTQWTSLGSKGFKHIPRIEAAYSSTTSVQFVITSFDGQSPQAITLPPTGGVEKRLLVNATFNKGQLYMFSATSAEPCQLFYEDFIIWVCDWGRLGEANPFKMGAEFGNQAPI